MQLWKLALFATAASLLRGVDKEPFSSAQRDCIRHYASEVDAFLPGYAEQMGQRHFGGSGVPHAGTPTLVAGFGTTATRSLKSLVEQMGFTARHFADGPRDVWQPLLHLTEVDTDELHGVTMEEGGQMRKVANVFDRTKSEVAAESRSFLEPFLVWLKGHSAQLQPSECVAALNAFNFSAALAGYGVFMDTPVAETFLDLYALSPESKVILPLRPADEWARARESHRPALSIPTEMPCRRPLESLSLAANAALFDLHSELVRCVVPKAHLLEYDLFTNGSSGLSKRVATFMGKSPTEWDVPFPKVSCGMIDDPC